MIIFFIFSLFCSVALEANKASFTTGHMEGSSKLSENGFKNITHWGENNDYIF